MAKAPPNCKNRTCPLFGSNREVIVLQERVEDVSFGCKGCGGVEVRTLDPRRGQQELQYQQYGRPEYARNKAYFFQGSKHGSSR